MKEIWGLMRQAAPEIPFGAESETDQERALTEVMECCIAEFSSVVVDGKQKIVGALLAKRDLLDWGVRNATTINVSVAAALASHREQGVFKMLFDAIVKRNAPVYIGVKPGEGQGLAEQLKSSGFSFANASPRGEIYKWEPAVAGAKAA